MKKIFFDTEFTGLTQNTSLISIGLVADTGEKIYIENLDWDKSKSNDWINTNVIKNTFWLDEDSDKIQPKFTISYNLVSMALRSYEIKEELIEWFDKFGDESIEIWSDCLAYDWVLFCNIFGGAFNIPSNIYYIPFDLCTLMKIKGIDPDINREKFADCNDELVESKHNSLHDAEIIKKCYEKITIAY